MFKREKKIQKKIWMWRAKNRTLADTVLFLQTKMKFFCSNKFLGSCYWMKFYFIQMLFENQKNKNFSKFTHKIQKRFVLFYNSVAVKSRHSYCYGKFDKTKYKNKMFFQFIWFGDCDANVRYTHILIYTRRVSECEVYLAFCLFLRLCTKIFLSSPVSDVCVRLQLSVVSVNAICCCYYSFVLLLLSLSLLPHAHFIEWCTLATIL